MLGCFLGCNQGSTNKAKEGHFGITAVPRVSHVLCFSGVGSGCHDGQNIPIVTKYSEVFLPSKSRKFLFKFKFLSCRYWFLPFPNKKETFVGLLNHN